MSINCITPGLTSAVSKCPYCNKDFAVLGRHIWRCQSKLTSADTINIHTSNPPLLHANAVHNSPVAPPPVLPIAQVNDDEEENTVWVVCHCGRRCKGRRGLRAHQRHCVSMDNLLKLDPDIDRAALTLQPIPDLNQPALAFPPPPNLNTLPCLKLPRTQQDWALANTYLSLNIPPPPPTTTQPSVIDMYIENFQASIYNYFHDNYGVHSPDNKTLPEDNDNRLKRKLRKQLQDLKLSNAPAELIKSISI